MTQDEGAKVEVGAVSTEEADVPEAAPNGLGEMGFDDDHMDPEEYARLQEM